MNEIELLLRYQILAGSILLFLAILLVIYVLISNRRNPENRYTRREVIIAVLFLLSIAAFIGCNWIMIWIGVTMQGHGY